MKPFSRSHKSRKTASRKPRAWGLFPHAARYLIAGHILILVFLAVYAAHLYSGSNQAMLYIEDFLTSVGGAWILMWGFGVLLDYLERVEINKTS